MRKKTVLGAPALKRFFNDHKYDLLGLTIVVGLLGGGIFLEDSPDQVVTISPYAPDEARLVYMDNGAGAGNFASKGPDFLEQCALDFPCMPVSDLHEVFMVADWNRLAAKASGVYKKYYNSIGKAYKSDGFRTPEEFRDLSDPGLMMLALENMSGALEMMDKVARNTSSVPQDKAGEKPQDEVGEKPQDEIGAMIAELQVFRSRDMLRRQLIRDLRGMTGAAGEDGPPAFSQEKRDSLLKHLGDPRRFFNRWLQRTALKRPVGAPSPTEGPA